MRNSIINIPVGSIAFLALLIVGAFGQASAAPTGTTTTQSAQSTFQAEKEVLADEEQSLIDSGATPQQVEAWRKANASALVLQQQRVQSLAAAQAGKLLPVNRVANIPANATQVQRDFLTSQATLANARAQVHNRLVQQALALKSSLTVAQLVDLSKQEEALYRQQNATLIATQNQRAKLLASPLTHFQGLSGTFVPSPNTTPAMASYLSARNQMAQELLQIRKQYANATPAVEEAAELDWYQKNQTRMEQLREQALAVSDTGTLSSTSTTTQANGG